MKGLAIILGMLFSFGFGNINAEATVVCPTCDVNTIQEGLIKINPMLNWSGRDVWRYIQDYDLPEHPLSDQGYGSIGCRPCTRPIIPGEDERSGRWIGLGKTECGLHTDMFELKGRDPAEVMKTFIISESDPREENEE